MKLYLDVGNTRIKYWLDSNSSPDRTLLKRDVLCDAIAHGKEFDRAMESIGCNLPTLGDIKEVWVSNVAGDVARLEIEAYCQERFGVQANFAKVKRELYGIKAAYTDLSELGVDRWLAILGSRELKELGSVIVINCGTAITVDWLDEDNTFRGGAILPGFDLAFSALNKTANIGHFSAIEQSGLVGVTTEQCVSKGVVNACVGGVEKLVNEVEQNKSSSLVLVSGGASSIFFDATHLEYEYDANLVIRGLIRLSYQ